MLRRLLTFPDARGQRWSTFRLQSTRYKLMRWRKVWAFKVFIFVGCGVVLLKTVLFTVFALYLLITDSGIDAETRDRLINLFLFKFPSAGAILLLLLSLQLRFVATGVCIHLLIRGHCPTCAYSIANLPPTDPINCPECGAAWHPVPSKPTSTN